MNSPQFDITWDPAKAASNLSEHGVSFAEAASILMDPLSLTVFDAGHGRDEERWFTLGMSCEGKLLAVAHTCQPDGLTSTTVRIISARPVTRNEHRQYENEPR